MCLKVFDPGQVLCVLDKICFIVGSSVHENAREYMSMHEIKYRIWLWQTKSIQALHFFSNNKYLVFVCIDLGRSFRMV